MAVNSALLAATPVLDYQSPGLQALVKARGWRDLPEQERIGALYRFVQSEILFGYNASDDLPASEVLREGIGQCNTKGNLLMALLRACGIPCRFHGFTIDKALQKGEGFILASPTLRAFRAGSLMPGSSVVTERRRRIYRIRKWIGKARTRIYRRTASITTTACSIRPMSSICGTGRI